MIFRKTKLEQKQNPVSGAYLINGGNNWKPAENRQALIKEGYETNVIVYRAIREITSALADITLQIKQNGEIIEDSENHPAIELLRSPNPMQGYDQFIKNIFTDYLLNGETAIVKDAENNTMPAELWALNPVDVQVMAGKGGMPAGYKYKKGSYEKQFAVDQISGDCQLFFFKTYNPSDYWRGFPPLRAAALSADTHNAGMKWNYKLLKNSARPSGLVKYKDMPSGETLSRLREFFKKTIQGENNSGELPILTGDAEWVAMDNSPRDMDFLNTMKESSKYIASAFGVPLPLIDNDASTFNNLEQAKERLWTDTVIPLLNEFLNRFSTWYLKPFGDNLQLCADLDSVSALESVRARRYDRMKGWVESGILSIDEARAEAGYEQRGGIADALFISQGKIPIEMTGMMDELPEDEKAFAFTMKSLGFTNDEIKATLTDDERIPPKGASESAKKVLRWREEHGDEVNGMTATGWTRANQLAKRERLSEDTIKRMHSFFSRHAGNEEISEENKATPWKDAGYVSYLGWGGATGKSWSARLAGKLRDE